MMRYATRVGALALVGVSHDAAPDSRAGEVFRMTRLRALAMTRWFA
jgi:hypothetical protein